MNVKPPRTTLSRLSPATIRLFLPRAKAYLQDLPENRLEEAASILDSLSDIVRTRRGK